MELIAIYLGFLGLSGVGAHLVAAYTGESWPYILAGTALAAHIAGLIGAGYEKKWGPAAGVSGLVLSALMIVGGASAFLERLWPLYATAGVAASVGLYLLVSRHSDRREARGMKPVHDRLLIALALFPVLAAIALSIALRVTTGFWY